MIRLLYMFARCPKNASLIAHFPRQINLLPGGGGGRGVDELWRSIDSYRSCLAGPQVSVDREPNRSCLGADVDGPLDSVGICNLEPLDQLENRPKGDGGRTSGNLNSLPSAAASFVALVGVATSTCSPVPSFSSTTKLAKVSLLGNERFDLVPMVSGRR